MIMDMVVYVSTFVDDDTFQQIFSYIRNKHLQSRNKHINRIKSASLLTVRLSDPLGLDFPTGIMFIKYNSTMIEKNHQFDLLSSLAQTVSFAFNQFIQGQ